MSDSLFLRPATESDADALLRIYAPYVTDTAVTFEYTVPSTAEFAARIGAVERRHPYLVAVDGEAILGYAYVGTFHDRPAYDWSVETSIYVDRTARQQGIGRTLYDGLEQSLKAQGILNLNACIAYPRGEDEYLTRDSVAFHEHLGYRMVGRFDRCGYKFRRWYDMVWMEKLIGPHPADAAPVRPFAEVLPALRRAGVLR